MSFLWLIRLFTILIAVSYGVAYAPWDKIEMFFNPNVSIIGETSSSLLFTSGTLGIYVTPVVAVALVFIAVPRWRLGTRALSLCFFLMGVSLLTRLEETFVWQQYLSIFIQLRSGALAMIHILFRRCLWRSCCCTR